MLATIQSFKERVVTASDPHVPGRFYEAVADFGDHLNRGFRDKFPDLEPAIYWAMEEWQEIICSTLPAGHTLADHVEVRAWLQDEIASFLLEQEKSLFV